MNKLPPAEIRLIESEACSSRDQHVSSNPSEHRELRLTRTIQNYNVVLPLSRDSPLQSSAANPEEISTLVHLVSGVPSKCVFNRKIKVNHEQGEWIFKNEEETETRHVAWCGSPIREITRNDGNNHRLEKNPPSPDRRGHLKKKYCSYCGNRRSRSPSCSENHYRSN
ncbi:unnamed protein product [Ceutorhynchus assimilis]|uniref:Uncharacterized protein n=1 Tax=Ceutorhynchus assimilis TaxID=467358 RepID=A0A9N9QNZ5_9CUCU|nr:unnamed protein product [Ceutorhynchus assimilis]